jgi:beta-glucanase (GH16 family)
MNSQLGPSGAFWLQSPTFGKIIGQPDSSGTEIDIAEYRQKEGDFLVHHTIHWDGYGKSHQQKGTHKKVKDFDKDFHTFGLEWTEKKYIFYIDGKKTWTCSKAVSQVPEYIILSLELNGWGGDPSNSTFPDQVVYDWVRVWQVKE